MLAFQQSSQPQQQQQHRAVGGTSASAAAVLPVSTTASNSRLRFGSTSIASWTDSSKPDPPHHASPKSQAAYRLHAPHDAPAPAPLRSQLGSHAAPRPARTAGGHHWQRPLRRVPNTSDISKQWRASPAAADPDARQSLAINTAAAPRETPAPYISSTFQDTDSPLLSGLSLALHKHHPHGRADGSARPAAPLYDIAQPRTPHPLSPADSMKTPGYVDPESLPFDLGSTIVDPKTGRQYRLLSVLGEGSYAVVYLAHCSQDGAKYALKCLSKLDLTPRQLALQRTELEIHASVCVHPHIVTLYSHFETGDWLFLVMERVSGPDLYDYITQHPAFNANQEERRFVEATRLFEQMIDAVAHIHALKAYHRDLKPENFIIGADGNLKLTDFGLATRESLSEDFECGSKPYMSYENRNGGLDPNDESIYGPRDDYSPRLSDVWALGVLFLNLLFAQSPWTDPSRDSCFKFYRFQRQGAAFLIDQFPKLPREVADFLVTRVFSPESGRCNVLELKQWVQELKYLFSPLRSGAAAAPAATAVAPRTAAFRYKAPAAAVATPARKPSLAPVAPLQVPGAAVAQGATAGRKWLPVVHAKVPSYAPPATAATPEPIGMSAKPKSPLAWRSPATPHGKTTRHELPTALAGKPNNLSTSVPALVFSQIIPATQAAAARKMMPREHNHTAAKAAAAAILQSSMLCLPKNGLGQGKQDCDDDAAYGAHAHHSHNSNNLESLSEAEEADDNDTDGRADGPAYSAAATDMASRFPRQPSASSLGFSAFDSNGGSDEDDDEGMGDYREPTSFNSRRPARQRLASPAGAKSLPPSALKKPVPRASAATMASTVNGSSFSDDLDVLGRFSDDDISGSYQPTGAAAATAVARVAHHQSGSSRVRFRGIPRSPPPAVVPLPHGAHGRTAHGSADSSLTGTLVSPSTVDFYSPHLQSCIVAEIPSTTSTAVGDSADADDEAESSRRRARLGGVLRHAHPGIRNSGSAAKPVAEMHSLPVPFHSPGKHKLPLDGLGHTTFSWADDADDLPIPGLHTKLGPSSVGARQYTLGAESDDDDEDAMSDDLSWSAGHDDYRIAHGDDMFDMEL